MAPRGPRPALLFTLALLATGLALASGQSWTRLMQKFAKEHVDFPRTPAARPRGYCKEMMNTRGLFGKPRNTFIHASMRKICQVCTWGGTHVSRSLRRSKSRFRVTTCRFDWRTRSYRGTPSTRKILIACWKRRPVLYVE